MLNKVFLMGRLTADPELRTTTTGKNVVEFTLAVDRGYGQKKQTDFFRCFAWEKTGELIAKHFDKGALIIVTGELQTRQYEKDGQKRTICEINVREASFTGERRKESNESPQSTAGYDEMSPSDELPF